MELSGSRVVVTGASSGIGEAIVLALAGRGARLSLCARRVERLQALAERVAKLGGEALVCPVDVRDEKALRAVFSKSVAHWGGLDILINNAGVGRLAPLHGGSTELWREMQDVNVLALAVACREALASFDAERGGHIVNISSLSGHRVPASGGFYAATKYAVRALTESLRQELVERSSKTRVSSISPGFVRTEFHDGLFGDDSEARQRLYPRYEVLQAADVAASVLHVLEAPEHVAVHDVLLRSREQPS